MSEDPVIDAFGARWVLDAGALDPGARDRLHRLWERCRVPGARPGDEGVEPFVVTDPDPYAVSRALTLASLRRRRGTAVLLHAAGLESGGRVVALVGPSGAGKSTAALALGRALGYVSDEVVAVEPDSAVTPYPKPVSVVTDPDAPWDKHEEGPDALGLREVSGTAYLRAVVVLERDPAHAVPELAPLPLVDALLAVVAQTSSLPLLDRPLRRVAELLDRSGGPYALRYSEIGDCLSLVSDLLGGHEGRERRTPDRARGPWTTTPGQTTTSPPGTREVVRAPWRDAVHGEGGTVVLVGEDVVRLGPLGEVVWRAAADAIPAGAAVEAVVAALGEHPDAERVVRDGIDVMVRTGVLLSR